MVEADTIPFGKVEKVMAPWGKEESAHTFLMTSWSGKTKYAVVMNPVGNKPVRCSVFKVDI